MNREADRERLYLLRQRLSVTEGVLRVSDEVQRELAQHNYGTATDGIIFLQVIGVDDYLARKFAVSRLTQIEEILRWHSATACKREHKEFIDGLINEFFPLYSVINPNDKKIPE